MRGNATDRVRFSLKYENLNFDIINRRYEMENFDYNKLKRVLFAFEECIKNISNTQTRRPKF